MRIRRKKPELLIGSTIGLTKTQAKLRTSLPHVPVRWCYGLPLTTDPRRFYPDPRRACPDDVANWKRALDAVKYDNEYDKPRRVGDAHSEPWGIGITIFPESRDWPGRWDIGGPRLPAE